MSLPGLSSDASEDMFMFLDLKTLMMGLSLVNKSLHDKIMNASERLWLFRLDHMESLAKTKARKGRVFRNECFRGIDNNQFKNETKSLILFRIFRKQAFFWNAKKLGQELLEMNGQVLLERIQNVSYKPYVSYQKGLLVGKLMNEPVCDFKLFHYVYGENPLEFINVCRWYDTNHVGRMMGYFRGEQLENGKTMIYNFLKSNRHLVNKKIIDAIGRGFVYSSFTNAIPFVFFNLPFEKCVNGEGKMEYMTGYEIELLHGNGLDKYLRYIEPKMKWSVIITMDVYKQIIVSQMKNMKTK